MFLLQQLFFNPFDNCDNQIRGFFVLPYFFLFSLCLIYNLPHLFVPDTASYYGWWKNVWFDECFSLLCIFKHLFYRDTSNKNYFYYYFWGLAKCKIKFWLFWNILQCRMFYLSWMIYEILVKVRWLSRWL